MESSIELVHEKIVEVLEKLISTGDIKHIHLNWKSIDPLTEQMPDYPAACIESASFSSEEADTSSNVRTILMPITFICRASDFERSVDVDILKEKISNFFDKNFDLGLAGTTYLQPAASSTEVLDVGVGEMLVFSIELSVEVLISVLQ